MMTATSFKWWMGGQTRQKYQLLDLGGWYVGVHCFVLSNFLYIYNFKKYGRGKKH